MSSTVIGSWADAGDEFSAPDVTVNPDGSKTVITFRLNPEGKKVRLTQRIREVKVQEKVHPLIAQRKNWLKFGNDKGSPPGPDSSTTQLGEKVELKLNLSWKQIEKEEEEDKEQNRTVKKGVMCRTCHSTDHFTMNCPFKDTLGAAAAAAAVGSGAPEEESGRSSGGTYVPRHKRPDASGIVPTLESRDDATTLKVSQLNSIVDEDMIRHELFANFGPLKRVTLVKNRETGESRGFAYVSFDSIQMAERVLELFNGKGYMSLILRLEWSKKKKPIV